MVDPSGRSASSDEVSEPTTAEVPQGWRARIFCSNEYFSLWIAQVISAMGDWIGLFAITALAASISGAPEAAIALVITARVAPSFFLGPFMGVLVDRYDRKLLMRISDIARAAVFVALPFVNTLWGLVLASLLLEMFTLIWSPAKESLVPLLVPRRRLTTANSLGVLAAYGTMPFAGVIQFFLKEGNDALAGVEWLGPFQFDQAIGETQALAFYFNALTFLATAFIVWRFIPTPAVPKRRVDHVGADGTVTGASGIGKAIADMREGLQFVFANRVVRAVNVSLAAALLGGAILVPLGPIFAKLVIGDTNAFSLYITALGVGVAIGVAVLTAFQNRVPKTEMFVFAELVGGAAFIFGVSMSTFWFSALGIFTLGLFAGAVYILGFTLLQENTADEMRGRTFATFLTIVRLCVLGSMVLGPALSALLDKGMHQLIDERGPRNVPIVAWFNVDYMIPGVRVTLWIGGALIIGAGLYSAKTIGLRLRRIWSRDAWTEASLAGASAVTPLDPAVPLSLDPDDTSDRPVGAEVEK